MEGDQARGESLLLPLSSDSGFGSSFRIIADGQIQVNRSKALQPTLTTLLLPYIKKKNWWFDYERQAREETEYLEREGGKFAEVIIPDEVSLKIVRPSDMLPTF